MHEEGAVIPAVAMMLFLFIDKDDRYTPTTARAKMIRTFAEPLNL